MLYKLTFFKQHRPNLIFNQVNYKIIFQCINTACDPCCNYTNQYILLNIAKKLNSFIILSWNYYLWLNMNLLVKKIFSLLVKSKIYISLKIITVWASNILQKSSLISFTRVLDLKFYFHKFSLTVHEIICLDLHVCPI